MGLKKGVYEINQTVDCDVCLQKLSIKEIDRDEVNKAKYSVNVAGFLGYSCVGCVYSENFSGRSY